MKKLTKKEEVIMNHFWEQGPLFVRELRELYPEPRPHFSTLSTQVRMLEEEGFIGHKAYGPTYQYFAKVTQDDYKENAATILTHEKAHIRYGHSFVVAKDGAVKDVKIVNSICEELDNLVLSLIQESPKWEPATLKGKPVEQCLRIPIAFEMR